MAAPMRLCGQRMEKIVTDFPINYSRKWRTLKLIFFLFNSKKGTSERRPSGRGRGSHTRPPSWGVTREFFQIFLFFFFSLPSFRLFTIFGGISKFLFSLVLDTFFFRLRGKGRGTHLRDPTQHRSNSGAGARISSKFFFSFSFFFQFINFGSLLFSASS